MSLPSNKQHQMLPQKGFSFILEAKTNVGNCRNGKTHMFGTLMAIKGYLVLAQLYLFHKYKY